MARRNKRHPGIVPVGPGRYRVVCRIRKGGEIAHKQETIDGTVEQAKALFERFKTELRTGAPVGSLKSSVSTFGEVLGIYGEKNGPFSPAYTHLVEKVKRELGAVLVDQFAERFESDLRLLKQTKTKRGGLPSCHLLNRRIEVARAAFGVAVAVGVVEKNPVTRQRFPEKREIPRDVSITEDDRANLIAAAREGKRTKHLADALNYALQVPIRKGEIVNMQVQDVDLFSKCVRVRNGTTKNDQGTYKPIPPDMVEYFTRRVREGKPEEPVFFRLVKGSRGDRSGAAVRVAPLGDFKGAWHTVRKAANLPDLRIHDTRHVSATAMVDAGTPEQVVMSVANWKTNMLRTYYHRDPKKALELVRFGGQRDSVVIASVADVG